MNNLCGQGRELWLDKLWLCTGHWVTVYRETKVGKGNVLTDCYYRARLGEKYFLRGRDIPLLKRKNEGPNQSVQYILISGQIKM